MATTFFEQCQFAAEVDSPRGSNFASAQVTVKPSTQTLLLFFIFLVLLFLAFVFASLSQVRVEVSWETTRSMFSK